MKHREDYGSVKGFNYLPSTSRNSIEIWRDYNDALVERELSYASRIGLNAVRVLLSYVAYADNRKVFLEHLLHFVRTSASVSIDVVPVFWDSCFTDDEPRIDVDDFMWYPNPGVQNLDEHFWAAGEQYCSGIIDSLRKEPNILMFDVHNEPLATTYVLKCDDPSEKGRRLKQIWGFVRHFAQFVKTEDPETPITVGIDRVDQTDEIGECVDVLSFHDYSPTYGDIEKTYDRAHAYSSQYRKPVVISELGCPARGNPYDIAIQIANRYRTGYFLWELMIGRNFWHDRTGVIYPDGTVRDPSIICAINGFFRKREDETLEYNINSEGNVSKLLKRADEWLQEDGDRESGIEILTTMAFYLESGELVPMTRLPTNEVWKLKTGDRIGAEAISNLMHQWMKVLEEDASKKPITIPPELMIP